MFTKSKKRLVVSYQDFINFVEYCQHQTQQQVLAKKRKVTRQTLSTRFSWFLASPPNPKEILWLFPPKCISKSHAWVYGFDGKWLGRSLVILIHRDIINKEVLYWSVCFGETIGNVRTDLVELGSLGMISRPVGAITDGKPGVSNLIANIFQLAVVQRCLVHVLRELKISLPKYSPLNFTQELRRISLSLININSEDDKLKFFVELMIWYSKFAHLLKTRSYPTNPQQSKKKWWYTHKNLRKAWKLLNKDLELFVYLENPLIPKTNNSLEGLNRHLERRLGMSKCKQVSIMCWQLALSRVQNKQQLKQLWDMWKRRLY